MNKNFHFPKVQAALDMSAIDLQLINYCRLFVHHGSTTQLRFVHVVPQYIFPEAVGLSSEELMERGESLEARVETELTKIIQPIFEYDQGLEVEIAVLEGYPQKRILTDIKRNQPDLLLVGKKQLSKGSGILARRIARKATCAVCFVTEKATTDVKKVLVPVDFSDYTVKALRTAVQLQEQIGDLQIDALHVIPLPSTVYNINRNRDRLTKLLIQEAEEEFAFLLESNDLAEAKINFHTVLNEAFDVAKHIRTMAHDGAYDMIIIGAKGHYVLQDIIFGSVAEKLVTYEESIPVLVVRASTE